MLFYTIPYERRNNMTNFTRFITLFLKIILIGLALLLFINFLGGLSYFAGNTLFSKFITILLFLNSLFLLILALTPTRFVARYRKIYTAINGLILIIPLILSIQNSPFLISYILELILSISYIQWSYYLHKTLSSPEK